MSRKVHLRGRKAGPLCGSIDKLVVDDVRYVDCDECLGLVNQAALARKRPPPISPVFKAYFAGLATAFASCSMPWLLSWITPDPPENRGYGPEWEMISDGVGFRNVWAIRPEPGVVCYRYEGGELSCVSSCEEVGNGQE